MRARTAGLPVLVMVAWLLFPAAGAALPPQPTRRAEGFTRLPDASVVTLMPMDVQVYTLTAGERYVPRADWTAQALANLRKAILARPLPGGGRWQEPAGLADPDLAELLSLHLAVARAIETHHFGIRRLPSKQRRLEWTLGAAAGAIRAKAPADYALFLYLRDSYSTAGRKASLVAQALILGEATLGGQEGFASLVDLRSGRIVWCNLWYDGQRDVRTEAGANHIVKGMLAQFPD